MAKPDNPVALVTGGTKGIGLACAHALAASGHQVAVTFRSTPPPDDFPYLAVPCDVTDSASVDAAFTAVETELGVATVVVSNAGANKDMLMLGMEDEDFESIIDSNLTGAFRVAKRAQSKMLRQRWGRIIFMGSAAGQIGNAGQSNYAASKAGLVGMAKSLAREIAKRHITVNVVAPGPIETDMLAGVPDDALAAMYTIIPAQRAGTVDEVAAAVAFLASDGASYITGVVIPVDGGMTMAS